MALQQTGREETPGAPGDEEVSFLVMKTTEMTVFAEGPENRVTKINS